MTDTMPEKPRSRRRLAISLRAMIVVVLVVALVLGWKANKVREQRRAAQEIRKYGGFVHYDWEMVNGQPVAGRKPKAPGWLRRLVGDDYVQEIAWVSFVYDAAGGKRKETVLRDDSALVLVKNLTGVRTLLLREGQATDPAMVNLEGLAGLEQLYIWDAIEVGDAGVAHLAGLKNLKKIHLSKSKVTDAGLASLAKLPSIESLSLQENRFTDAGLAHFRDHPTLKELHLGLGTGKITDNGLESLASIKTLELLDIQSTKVTDKGLEILAKCPNLKEIWTSGSSITPEALKKFEADHPTVKILR